MDPPEFSNNNEVFSNAWTSTFIPSGGNFDFATDEDFFACSFEMKTTINDAAILMESTHGAPPASFEIFTGNDLPSPNSRYLLSVLASNEMTTQIKPKMKFYVSRAEYPAGFIIDFKPASSCAGIVDLNSSEGQDKNIATVRYTNNGGFQLDYHA
ncbi:hypothetical protein N7478_010705 [Penicillium angulare]|uniref:uncharacterized protein n=1 Tax=Penicillium angulare TaxID=116970 RepID=UPI00254106D0|nr:uncharacterized protein N7478_010705 [Penicillium angulare]KAJ5267897.1 hypothetical protein N7478_010705 [Penicillium angulare]